MRRFITTLMILLVVLVVGLSALVLMVNPNDFRAYMVREVEQRSGYQLTLDGGLRWHVWPKLSILSGRMQLTAPGATHPLISAENMRLDVALWPLLSHQLSVDQVMLKRAVIELSPETEARRPQGAPKQPGNDSEGIPVDLGRGWSFDIGKLSVTDSLLVFQHAADEQITVRDINLQMEQNENHQGQLTFSARINRDQRDLTLAMDAGLDASSYPHILRANFTNISYQYQGADLPPQGIRGMGKMQLSWLEADKKLAVTDFGLTANDSTFNGSFSVNLTQTPQWQMALSSPRLNLDNLLVSHDTAPVSGGNSRSPAQGSEPKSLPRPVISGGLDQPEMSALQGFIGNLALNASEVIWRGLTFNDVALAAQNKLGLATISKLEGRSGSGTLSLPATLDARTANQQITVAPKIDNVEIGPILTAFHYPLALTGKVSLDGAFSGTSFDALDFRQNWQGKARISMQDSRMQGMNFQQMIQQAVVRNRSDVKAQQNYDDATILSEFTADAVLHNGTLAFQNMAGKSKMLSLTGNGTLDLNQQLCDSQFSIMVTGGWQGDNRLVELLKRTAIPLRVYGPWQHLSYNLQVDQMLRKQLQDEAKQRLKNWADRNKDTNRGKDIKQLLDKL
ncbi:outer membrane assembly protein AsmA [Shimwellia pseudoproteus]|uniref:outer membrane assembly protein AsmA n=1 Tax=Shimwellia pseudoproteus TaxID=570012 RepID=UPI0018EC52DC|nr:outer membrane assembly protein AsmA [Shimwellia pseudoproteus]MBJ3816463.1 outer membrane assembly protein AsmA [Shimwellia pseudoproteus]